MKIQFLNGGLANQTFQYIFARHYELSHPGEVMYLDDSYFALHTVHNGYELEKVFGVKPHMLSECFDADVWEYMLEEKKRGKSIPQIFCENDSPMYMVSEVGDTYKNFNPFQGDVFSVPCNQYLPKVQDVSGDIYYHGYWINRLWMDAYKTVFKEELSFPELTDAANMKYRDDILNHKSLALHIRRGDFVSLGWAAPIKNLREVVDWFISEYTAGWDLFVFSDDIAWCKENSKALGMHQFKDVCFVEGNGNGKNYIDMQLMSYCKGMILSNSSFSYLAALLNEHEDAILNPTKRYL